MIHYVLNSVPWRRADLKRYVCGIALYKKILLTKVLLTIEINQIFESKLKEDTTSIRTE